MWISHGSIAGLTNGRSDFSNARFFRMWVDVEQEDGTIATEQHLNTSGTLTFSGGNYSLIKSQALQTISGTSQTFNLMPDLEYMKVGGNYISYTSKAENGKDLDLLVEADGGLNSVTASWNFPDMPSFNGQAVIPNFRTTQEQLASFVPYIEFVRAGSQVTGIKWRLAKSTSLSTPETQNFSMGIRVTDVFTGDSLSESLFRGSWDKIPANTTPEGTINFDSHIDESDIYGIRIGLYTYDEENVEKLYDWYFLKLEENQPVLWVNHRTNASLVDGKPDYSTAQFSHIYMSARDLTSLAEANYFTTEGTMTIPGGGYTMKNYNTDENLGSVALNRSRTFSLKMDENVDFADDYIEYMLVDDEGNYVTLAGDAEKNLSGKTIIWDFPDELHMDGMATVPQLKTTEQQLTSGVPYIEVVSADNKITSIKYKIVTSNDASTALTPSYKTDFRLYVDHTTGNSYGSGWINGVAQGEWKLGTPQDLSTLRRFRVRLRHNEDTENPVVCQWDFTLAEAPAPDPAPTPTPAPSSGGSSGGCNNAFGFAALFVTGTIIRLKFFRKG